MTMRKQWLACLIVSALVLPAVQGLQVFLTSLAIHNVHRVQPIEGGLDMYFRCDGGDRVGLPDVRVRDDQYSWPNEDLLVTTITRGGCKHCAFYEDRKLPFVPDDRFGDGFQLCTEDFAKSAEDFVVRQTQEGEFEAAFYCADCAALPPPSPPPLPPGPPPPDPPPPPPDPLPDTMVVDGEADQAADDSTEGRQRGLSVGAIVGIAVGGASLLSCIGAAVAMTVLNHYRRKWADERAREFEAVFSDPELDLEEVAAEDARAVRSWRWLQPNTWTRLRDTQVSQIYNEGF